MKFFLLLTVTVAGAHFASESPPGPCDSQCRLEGKCVVGPGGCGFGTDDQCRASEVCAESGLATHATLRLNMTASVRL